jgi:hypothetical protein
MYEPDDFLRKALIEREEPYIAPGIHDIYTDDLKPDLLTLYDILKRFKQDLSYQSNQMGFFSDGEHFDIILSKYENELKNIPKKRVTNGQQTN